MIPQYFKHRYIVPVFLYNHVYRQVNCYDTQNSTIINNMFFISLSWLDFNAQS